MKLATEILRHFYYDSNNGRWTKTLSSFTDLPLLPVDQDELEIIRICNLLEREGHLIQGTQAVVGHHPILGKTYLAPDFDEVKAEYGSYEFMVHGFKLISEQFSNSVLPVIVTKENGDQDIGTCFLVDNSNTLITAKHVIDNMKEIQIIGDTNLPIHVNEIFISEDDELDVAVLNVKGNVLNDLKPFSIFKDHNLLDEVLCIGYPTIPGFHNLQILDIASINSEIRSSTGGVVGSAESYLDKQPYILLNARVKGGNSGGPVINRYGDVVGILVQTSMDSNDTEKLDSLGYGIAIPKQSFINLLRSTDNSERFGKKLKFSNIENGGFSTISN